MESSARIVKQYAVLSEPRVGVKIVETIDGKYRYIVEEPSLDEEQKHLLKKVVDSIVRDVSLIRKISGHENILEGYPVVLDIVVEIVRSVLRYRKVSEEVLRALAYYIARDFIGYGPLDPLLRDTYIEDVTCNGIGVPIFVFHNEFEWLETNIVFTSPEDLERVVFKLAYRAGQEPTIAQPIVEGIIRPEGYRVHIVLDVVSRRGHSFTVRKYRSMPYSIVELIIKGTLDPGLASLFWLAADNQQGMIIYGPTGSGKTTLLNAVAMLLPPELKIVTVEDTPEIVLPFHDNWVSMVTRLSSDPYIQNVTLQAQVESAMRQRPDILILGEIRSREAYSFFQAVSTGHGGLTTVHAENVESLIRRLVSPPMSVPKAMIATVKLFVQILRITGKNTVSRRVIFVHEVEGYDPNRDALIVKLVGKWIREENGWKVNLSNSSTLGAIADLRASSYGSILSDLEKRATLLWWAARKKLDIVSLYALVRKYRRDPNAVYDKVVEELGEPYRLKVLGSVEKKYV